MRLERFKMTPKTKKSFFIQLLQFSIVLVLLKFSNCNLVSSDLRSINSLLSQHFTDVNICHNHAINGCSFRIENFNTKAIISLNNSLYLIEYDIDFLSYKKESLILQINSVQFTPNVQIDLPSKYLPNGCHTEDKVIKCEFQVNESLLRIRRDVENLSLLKFTKNLYSFKALEKQASARVLVGKLQLNNENLLSLNNLVVTMKATRDASSENLFQIDAKTLEIYSKQILETTRVGNVHYFRVYIHKKREESPLASCSLVIHVINGEINTPPKFKFNTYEAQVFENNAPDTLLIKVEATDEDYGENARITYHLDNKNLNLNPDDTTTTERFLANPFHIKSDTGEIYARRILNREEKDFYVLRVLAIDNGSTERLNSSTQVFVRVLAQRDNAPKFERPAYNLTLSENADFLQRPVVLTVKALESTSIITNQTDFSSNNNNLIYSLHGSLNDLNTFEIDSKSGEIRLVSKLNYELKNLYQLSVIARDFGQPPCSTHSLLTVNIEDMNQNPPVFTAPFYEFILFENVPLGYSVGRVYAFDRDRSKTQDNSNIKYSIVNNGQEQSTQASFEIDATNGTIYTVRKLNRKSSNSFEFYVMALDTRRNSLNLNSNSSVKVKIKILDINDNVPEFSKPYYTLNISEEAAPVGLPLLTLTVKNKDLTSQLEYSIESGNENEMFSLIKPENNRVFFTLKRSNLNYKKKSNYILELKVMDSYGLYSITNLYINVLPSKNFSPRFTKDTYTFKIKESAPVGSLVGMISASFFQADTEMSSIVSYKIIVNTETDRTNTLVNTVDFRLDEQTGQLFVSNLLDREKYSFVTLYVTASDQNKPYRADHALIQIEILDVNDNKPVFTRQSYEIDVYENIKINSYLIRVEANDKDLGENGIVRYTLGDENGKFISIDEKTGIVRLNKKPTFSFLNISLTASDMGQPSLSSHTFILVKNMFSVDSPPYFDRNSLVFYLVENQPAGTVLGELKARDINSDYFNSNIVYKILDKSGNDFFELKQLGRFNTVLLTTKFAADYDQTEKAFTFQIRAYSLYSFSDCSINVIVRSLNDNPPLVESPFKVVFNNYKNYFLTEQTARVPIYNLDVTSNLTYKLVDSVGKQLVHINSKTGQITLKSILNSNNQINASFQISVHDGMHEVRTTCNLVVLMLSENLISESVTLNFFNVDVDTFLSYLYENFTNIILNILPPIVSSIKQSNIHVFGITNYSSGINVSLAVSYDYEKDIFMPASMLKQIVYSNMGLIKSNLKIHRISIYQDTSCAIEPCLNFQKCSTNVKFQDASPFFIESSYIQFRSIEVKHDFSCSCPLGFTGKNVSLMCDLEINLCYSNPCGQNGICVSLESGFRCICDPNFTGRMCEYDMKRTTCCELAEAPKARSLDTKNKTRITINNCVTAKPSIYDFYSLELSNNRVCKGDSVCKNLILGGVLCDKCGETSSHGDEKTKISYYNKFCELRARHFPENSNSFLVFEGIRNRLRFKIKLSFATIKSDSILFYNGVLETNTIKSGIDFVQLEIRNDFLVFSYSLGDILVNELVLDSISVSDGKWRTATVEYIDRNVTLSVDNDDLDHVDACDFARNKDSLGSLECFRVNNFYNLPKKCENQIETCFRYFDLNGPFNLGRGREESNSFYEGCISDVYLDDQMINFDEDILLNHKTQIGCQPKENKCKSNDVKCSNCKHLWFDKFKCSSNDREDGETFSLARNGYLLIEKNEAKAMNDLVIQFSVKFNLFVQSIKPTKLMRLESDNFKLDLNYDLNKHILSLTNIANDVLIAIAKSDLLTGSFWNTIEIKISTTTDLISLKVNDLFVKNSTISSSIIQTYYNWFLGGVPNNSENWNGCIKDIKKNGVLMNPLERINVTKGCPSGKISLDKLKICGTNSPCYNNGTCTVDATTGNFVCTCLAGFKGEFCQYKNKVSMKLFEKACPAKWWGKEPGICGPCECDESKNFSPDCVKNTGECQCKSKYYKTKEDRCVPCDCYLEGSTSLQCEPLTGQCPCLKGAGITGRRCDQCVAPLAEMTIKGNECRQLNSNECPRALGFNVWWPRTPFNTKANSSCPKGSIGVAYRTCVENVGWLNDVDVSGCSSVKLIETQLLKWSKELNANKSQLNSYQAFKLVEELQKLTTDADIEESNENDLERQVFFDSSMKNGHLSTSLNALYAIDFIVIKNLTQIILQYEIENAPEFLYIQDKHFLTNIFSVLNVMLSKHHEIKFYQLKNSETSALTNVTSYSSLTDILIKLDTYLKLITEHQQGYSLNENDVQINLPNIQLFMKTIEGQSFSEATQNVKFKLLESSSETTSVNSNLVSHKLAFVSLNGPSCNFPNELVTASYNTKSKKQIQPIRYSNFLVASNVFILNSVSIIPNSNQSTSTKSTDLISQSSKSFYIIVDFDLTNNYESLYDSTANIINYLDIKVSKADYKCVYLNKELKAWSTYGAKLIAYDPQTNTVKCSYDHFSVYAVITPSGNFMHNSISNPVSFNLTFYVVMPLVFFFIVLTILCLCFLRRYKTPLSIIYINLCLNVFFLHLVFFLGINGNSSPITCKFVSILQHYFHLSSYLWLFIISLHLYRMLTELRDINKIGTCSPVFYYVIAYVTPTLIVSLTLGIKQDIYTNYDNMSSHQYYSSSIYCWFNLNNTNELFIVFLLPLALICLTFLILCMMSFKERKQSTFKQTDLGLVYHSLLSSLLLLPFKCLITVFLVKFLIDQINNTGSSDLFQYLYLCFTLTYSILMFLLFVLFNKFTKKNMFKAWLSLKNSSSLLNESLNASKSKLTNEFNNFTNKSQKNQQPVQFSKSALLIKSENSNNNNNLYQINIDKNPSQFVLDYHDFQNHTQSISTTTTSGTMDNVNIINNTTDDINSQDSIDYLKSNGYGGIGICSQSATTNNTSNGYLSHLANTTNNESTTNEESEFNYDFNRPHLMQQIYKNENIRECDVVDVEKILKTRNAGPNYHQQQQQQQNEQFKYAVNQMMMMENTPNKYYNERLNDLGVKTVTPTQIVIQHANTNQQQQQQPQGALFWPTTIAECDTSFLEGSIVYTPSKLPFKTNTMPPDLLTCSTNSNNLHQQHNYLPQSQFKNNSYNSNGSSGTTSNSQQSNPTNVFATSNSSLLLNGDGTNGVFEVSPTSHSLYQSNLTQPNFNYINSNHNQQNNICPIFTHTGSPNSSDNDSNNETRV